MQGVKKHLELIVIFLLLFVLVFAAYIHTSVDYKASAITMSNTSNCMNEAVSNGINEIREAVSEPQMSRADIELIALVTMAEAEGESEMGKRLVIDTILNRVDSDRFPDTVSEVIYQPYQFESMTNGRSDRCEVRDDICQLVIEELNSRTNDDVLFFRTLYYHNFGTPVLQEGNHYFSTL